MGIFDFWKKKLVEKKAEKIAENAINSIKIVGKKAENKKTSVTLEPLEIYSYDKPQIMDFVTDQHYRMLLQSCYSAHLYGSRKKIDLTTIMGVYPYEKYDWETLLRIVWIYQNYCKNLQQMENAGIKKVELICADDCECCKSLKNKKIPIGEIKELPMKECPFEENICRARYCAVADFDFE